MAIPDPSNQNKPSNGVFFLLLIVVVGMTVLFGSGILRFGLEGPMVYMLYTIAGLLTAYLCFGLLQSTGTFKSEKYGASIQLTGAIVAMVAVTGGGTLYERFAKPQPFSIRLVFQRATASGTVRAPVKGAVTVYLNAAEKTEKINDGTSLLQDIPSSFANQTANIELFVDGYSLKGKSTLTLMPNSTTFIPLDQKSSVVSEADAHLELIFDSAISFQMAGRPQRSLDITLSVKSDAIGDVPLAEKGVLEIAAEHNMVPIKRIPIDVGSSLDSVGGIIPPKTISKINVSALLSQNDLNLLKPGSFVFTISLGYLNSKALAYKTDPIPFTKDSISFQ